MTRSQGELSVARMCELAQVNRADYYRDWRAETQTIFFDKIMFWSADPAGHPDWSASPPPG